jgi:transposase
LDASSPTEEPSHDPNNRTLKNPYPFDRQLYRRRTLIERMFSRLKDFRRIAARYDKLAVT